MKKKITALILIFALTAGTSYWIGYSKGKYEGFWQELSSTLGLAHILRTPDGLTESGAKRMHQLSDFWIYWYFTTPKDWLSKEKEEEIEGLLVELVQWKVESGHPVGPQNPLVQMTLEEGEIGTEPKNKSFRAYRDNLESFLELHDLKIQPDELVNASSAAGLSENHLND